MDPALLALALVAGAVAAVNPCGFALLPAYLSVLVAAPAERGGQGAGDVPAALARAGRFTTGMAAGFLLVFGGVALVLTPLAVSVEPYLPVVTVVVGAVLVVVGAWLLTGRPLRLPGVPRTSWAPTASWRSQVGYGVTFALASLSCTAAPFLAVTAGALPGGATTVAGAYLAYAAGMAGVVGVLAVAAATAGAGLAARVRRAAPLVARAGGALLVVAGAYVAWYGWFELRVLAGSATSDPVVGAATRVQAAIAREVAAAGAPVLAAAVVAVAAVTSAAVVHRRRRLGRPGKRGSGATAVGRP